MLHFLYTIFIYPVYMLVEAVFFLVHIITDEHTGASIILLSIAINLMCLPIYNTAEQLQEKERAVQKRMKAKLEKIKNVFKGDERFMMISAYYRQNNYHPLYTLRSLFPLFIQIPFFIAAYGLLSNFRGLYGTPFLFFKDLGKPDALLNIGNISVNILPIVMTLINIAAAAVYTKDLPIKDKLQLYGTAFIFLVLLYRSPSGLVFYWTLNNIFSLVKNIFYKIKLTKKTWYIIALISSVFLTGITAFTASNKRPILFAGALTFVLLLLPVLYKIFAYAESKRSQSVFTDAKSRFAVFLTACIACMLFIGFVIPSALIASSPQEFSHVENFTSPFGIFYYTFTQVLGCLFWLICIYKLFPNHIQKCFTYVAVILLPLMLINAYIFKGNYGDMNRMLAFDNTSLLKHSLKYFTVNITVLTGALILTCIFLYSRLSKFISVFLKILILTFITVTVISAFSIQKYYTRIKDSEVVLHTDTDKAYRVSTTGQNIFIFMLDRSMNFFIGPIFENSELVKKEYTGFTLFENSIAFGPSTNMSTPSLFGGYEYTPEKINERANELLVNKHNEALSVLPKLFSEGGWNVSFTDPCWLNYAWVGDTSFFKSYDNMIAKNIEVQGKYRDTVLDESKITQSIDKKKAGIRRNMLYFSIFRILPSEIRRIFYAYGKYGAMYTSQYLPTTFLDAYSTLENMTNEIDFVDDRSCLNIIVNNMTHEPSKRLDIQIIKKDFLIPLAEKYCLNRYTEEHFYVNYLAHEACAKFFRFLKENNCWDNTRIIIVGDHGRYSMHTTTMPFLDEFSDTDLEPEKFIPLIMMKDFNEKGVLKKDTAFMTLADIPILATEGLSPELQKNPFTGIPFVTSRHKDVVRILDSNDWNAYEQLELTQFRTDESRWLFVRENVYDPACWSKTGF